MPIDAETWQRLQKVRLHGESMSDCIIRVIIIIQHRRGFLQLAAQTGQTGNYRLGRRLGDVSATAPSRARASSCRTSRVRTVRDSWLLVGNRNDCSKASTVKKSLTTVTSPGLSE
jgi:hypothetical protein